ncbi:MAG: hypothetical protein B7Z06_10790 [Flavobacteriales bacterium 32-35-8]|nr:MAG: hypothetical protein B7Z06_10790 [Flavobacteriales bacterium 32-35-8]
MKTIYKILSLVLVLTLSVSCDRDTGDIDYLNNRPNSLFFSGNKATLFVEDGAPNTYSITVGSTGVANNTTPYTISVDPSSTAVEGIDFDIITSTELVAGKIVSIFTIEAYFEPAITDGKIAILKLTAEDGTNIGLADTFTLSLFKLCPFESLDTNNYSATVFAFDEEAPGYNITLTPVPGTTNKWTVTTGWGTTFVSWATGDASYDGLYPYSGTITLNSDFTIDFDGDSSWATGGTGVFSPCTQVFTYTLSQGLFSSSFTTDVVLTPNEI